MEEKKLNFTNKIITNKIIFTTFCCGLLIFISCNIKQNHSSFDKTFIQLVSRDTSMEYPLLYTRILFFCQTDSNKILSLRNRELKELYDDGAFNMNYEEFLTKVLNQQMILQAKGRGHIFLIDKSIAQKYHDLTFIEFINFYCETRNNNQYIFRDGLSENKKNTVFYFLFINNYLSTYDDYMGVYHIRTTSVYLNN